MSYLGRLTASAVLLFALATALAIPSTHGGLALHVQFSGQEPPDGFTHLSWTMQVQKLNDPHASYFWAAEYYFVHGPQGGGTGYIGIQPYGRPANSSTPQRIAVFSVFGDDTAAVTASHCESGADGGPGQSCRVPYAWIVGRTYRFDVRFVRNSGDYETWSGSVTDTATGERMQIARWRVPRSWGMLTNGALAFAEYYTNLPSCSAQPYMQARFDAPVNDADGAVYHTSPVASDRGQACQTNAAISLNQSARSATLEAGLAGKSR